MRPEQIARTGDGHQLRPRGHQLLGVLQRPDHHDIPQQPGHGGRQIPGSPDQFRRRYGLRTRPGDTVPGRTGHPRRPGRPRTDAHHGPLSRSSEPFTPTGPTNLTSPLRPGGSNSPDSPDSLTPRRHPSSPGSPGSPGSPNNLTRH